MPTRKRVSKAPSVEQLALRFLSDVISDRKVGTLDRLFSGDLMFHDAVSGQPQGLEGLRQVVIATLNVVPDLQAYVESTVTIAEVSVIRWTPSGAYRAWPIPATWLSKTTVIQIFRAEAGKIVELWSLPGEGEGEDEWGEDDDDDGVGGPPAGPRWIPPEPRPKPRPKPRAKQS